MSDFAAYAPSVNPSVANGTVSTRLADPADAGALATVMAVRGGTVDEHVDRARRMIQRLDVLLIAERDGDAVGWCGVQKFALRPGSDPEWLIEGLTVVPEARREGVAARLLGEVLRAATESAWRVGLQRDQRLEPRLDRSAPEAGIRRGGAVGELRGHRVHRR